MLMTSSTSSSMSMTGGVTREQLTGGGVTCRAEDGVGLLGMDMQVGMMGTMSEAELEEGQTATVWAELLTSPPEAA